MPPQPSAAVIGFWRDRRFLAGEPKSVIDGKRRRLKCHHPAVLRVMGKRRSVIKIEAAGEDELAASALQSLARTGKYWPPQNAVGANSR